MITILLLILVATAFTGLVVGVAKDDYKWRVVADASNTLIMLILLVINMIQGNVVWIIICGVFAILDMLALTYNLAKCGQKEEKIEESKNTLDNTKSVLKEFIKEIEEYGSTRH